MPLDAANLEILANKQKISPCAIFEQKIQNNDDGMINLKACDVSESANSSSINQNWDISTNASSSGFSTNKKAATLSLSNSTLTKRNQ